MADVAPVTSAPTQAEFNALVGAVNALLTAFPREIAEMALAHTVGSEVERAYRRGTALEKRRELMEAWAAFVRGARTSRWERPVADAA